MAHLAQLLHLNTVATKFHQCVQCGCERSATRPLEAAKDDFNVKHDQPD